MNPLLRNVLGVLAGIVLGSLVNMGLLLLGSSLIPPPAGVDPTDAESIVAAMEQFEFKHFVFPFLAHALGTLAGAWVAASLAVSRKLQIGLSIGVFFLAGGIANLFLIPGPAWFAVLDVVVAYLPMGWLGGTFALGKAKGNGR
ncbi:MAG: hypothetical protein AAF399_03400 [Bacteroidota bacterium]